MKKLVVVTIPQYAKKETADLLRHRIVHDATMHNSIVEEYLKYGAGFYKNFYPNILSMPGAALGTKLFGKFKKVPAIICGAGPSLAKHLPVLESLKDRALIFAGGSSLNALSAVGIKPHFGAGIDPNPTQLERISSSKSTGLPFFFRNRMNHQALKMVQGPRLYIPGSGGYDTAEWFETELGIERGEILDEGYNVVNFCVEIARAMGCSPIIFVGVDLAFTGMQSYVSGVIEDNRVKKNEILKGSDFDLIALKKKDIHGKPAYTLWKWISESEWIGQYAKDHPKTTLINATEGGLGFPDVPNLSLKSVIKKHLTRKFNLDARIHRSVVPMPQVTRGKTLKLLNTIETSLQTCEKYLRVLLEEVEAMRIKIEKLEVVDPNVNFLSGRAALFEMDLADEVAYKYVLEVFNEVFARITYHEMQQLKQSTVPEKIKKLGQLAANAKRLTFLVQVAAVQQELIRISKLPR